MSSLDTMVWVSGKYQRCDWIGMKGNCELQSAEHICILGTNMLFRHSLTKLPSSERLAFWSLVWLTPVLFVGNWIRASSDSMQVMIFTTLMGLIVWPTVVLVTVSGAAKCERKPVHYGFTLGRGALWSGIAVLVAIAVKASAADFVPSGNWFPLSLQIIGAMGEELLFRVLAINAFASLLKASGKNQMWSILIAAGLFSLLHLPTKSVSFLLFLFITSVLLGLIYLKSKSMLFPMWGHATANASWFGGVVAILVYVLISAAGSMSKRSRREETVSVQATGLTNEKL